MFKMRSGAMVIAVAGKDDRDAEVYEKEAANLRERADRTSQRAAALIQRAVELETAL
jgi:hypothetical protein